MLLKNEVCNYWLLSWDKGEYYLPTLQFILLAITSVNPYHNVRNDNFQPLSKHPERGYNYQKFDII